MFELQADPARRKMVLTSQIIVAALVAGCLFLLLNVLLIVPGKPSSWDVQVIRPMTTVGLVAAFGILAARIIIPGIVTAQMLRQLAQREPEEPDWKDLFGVYQTALIIKAAMLEGAIFLLLIMYILEHSPWTLALAAVFLLMLLMHMPTLPRVDDWIERQSFPSRAPTMKRIALILAFTLPAIAAEKPDDTQATDRLPQPHFYRQASDPAWLASVVQFHGHLGPSVVAGARMGMIGLRAVEAKGFFDVEVTCEGPLAKPPQSCFLDGVQVATGATLGKQNLQWVQADLLTMRIKNTRTGKSAVLRPTPALLELLASFKPQHQAGTDHGHTDDEQLEAIARKIAVMPDNEIAVVKCNPS